MSGQTAGQAFRETLHERWSARGLSIDTRPYDELPQADRDDLEAAAEAAQQPFRDALASALSETRLYREAVSEIRRECDGVTPGGSYSSFARRILRIIKRLEGK